MWTPTDETKIAKQIWQNHEKFAQITKKKKTLFENLSLNHRFRNVCVINKYEYVRKVQKKKKTVFVE